MIKVNSNYVAFADDFLLLESVHSRREIGQSVYRSLEKFVEVCREKELKLSVDKMEAVMFGKARKLRRKPTFKIGNENIKLEKSMRYLGVIIDENLNWIPHVEQLRTKMIELYRTLSLFKTRGYDLVSDLIKIRYQVVE